ncbi:ribonuclease HIII [Cytobacillus sp. Hm23]
MANSVITVDIATINKMKKHYENISGGALPPGAIFIAKGPTFTITAYRSGKVLFQGKEGSQEAQLWESQQNSPSTSSSSINKKSTQGAAITKYSPPNNISTLSIIGSDEVGTGDYFGPITVVATYVETKHIPLLKELGVKDSKGLTDEKICSIAKNIISIIPYSLLILHNEKYNDLQASGMTQGKMKAILHNRAIQHVLKKIEPTKPDGILIDQFAEPSTYYKHLQKEKTIVKDHVYFSTKAEGIHMAVAAASIIARYAFLKEMTKLSKECGMELPKGAGAQVDKAAAKVISKLGIQKLKQYTKYHFANTEKAKKLI